MLKKRLDYGFNGYLLPSIPKAARSTRRRGSTKKKVEDKQMCAFDLLATIAGNLLLEGDVSQNSSLGKDQGVNTEDVVMKEKLDEVTLLKIEHCDHHTLTPASVISSSDCLVKGDDALDKIDLNDVDKGDFLRHCAKVEQCSDNGHDSHGSENVKFLVKKPPELIGSNSSFKLSSGLGHHACGSVPPFRGDNVKVVTRDADKNSSGCTHPSTAKTVTWWPPRVGGQKIRKLLASKYPRVAPKVKDGDLSDAEFRYIYCSRKTGYRRQRSQRIYPFKKRKIFHYNSVSGSDRNIGCKGIYSPDKGVDTNAASFGGHRANGSSSSSVTSQSTSFSSREPHVKVRVKSFRVPELFIEMPETATIGSLKRTVMEALTALLGGGLHVGVLCQGKKIRDDNITLLQSGISRTDKVESLGFTLEPNSLHASPPLSSEDNSLLLSTYVPEPVSRCPDAVPIHHGTCHPSLDHPIINVGNLIESDHDSAPSPAEISVEKGTVDSRALVALSGETPQALAVVPAHHRSKWSEMAQRRIRRPFSVTEVEALVEAVEKLGSGRWRDVKLRAFDNVKHRTYVDLKDKWKTLVHTARISPQQRRGEPVPQELLDRVLAAHAYWSQHQAKQQLKQPGTCLFL